MIIIFHTMPHRIVICNDISHKMFEKRQRTCEGRMRRGGLLCPFHRRRTGHGGACAQYSSVGLRDLHCVFPRTPFNDWMCNLIELEQSRTLAKGLPLLRR
jgi:hypothetical protein